MLANPVNVPPDIGGDDDDDSDGGESSGRCMSILNELNRPVRGSSSGILQQSPQSIH
jgi:hypothetical protein